MLWEEKVEKEKIQRCRVERLLATREKEKILNAERRTKFEERCAKMEEMAKETARRKHEELDKANAEMGHLKKVISDQFAEASQRNAEREEAASMQARVFMEIAEEEQKRLAKVRGEIATEKAKEVYKSSTLGIREVQNRRRMKVRREASRRAREEAALHRRTHKCRGKGKRKDAAYQNRRDASGNPVNKCLHSDKHIMECLCCQPPKSWGVTKSIPLAWGIGGMARKDRSVQVLPLQEQSPNNIEGKKSTCAPAEGGKSRQRSNTRSMIRRDKLRAKQQSKKKKQQKSALKIRKKCEEPPVPPATKMKGDQSQNTTGTRSKACVKPNRTTCVTRTMIRRDKRKAKQQSAGGMPKPSSFDTANVSTARRKQTEQQATDQNNENTPLTALDTTEMESSSECSPIQAEKDVLDEVVKELLALDDLYDPQLERLMKERRELMACI